MKAQLLRDHPYAERITGVWFEFGNSWNGRQCWFGRRGLGFGGSGAMYNAHYYDLFKRPMGRYYDGERRWRFFFVQLARGLREFVRG